MKKYSILILFGMLVVASCNKKPTVTPGKEDMLRTGKWMIESGTVTMKLPSGLDTILNYLNFLPYCHRDDYMVFHANGDGAIFSGTTKCSPADPDSVTIKWALGNKNNTLSLWQGFDFTYGITESILPYRFDTISFTPYLVLDTIHGVLDTLAGYTRSLVVLDTIWMLQFDSTRLQYNDIYNASLTNFSQSSFTINYWVYGPRPDSTHHHTGAFTFPDATSGGIDTADFNPIIVNDTMRYSITYRNF